MTVLPVSLSVEDPREPKVGDLEMPRGTDKQVGRFQISVHDVIGMTECDALEQHDCVALNLRLGQWSVRVTYDLRHCITRTR